MTSTPPSLVTLRDDFLAEHYRHWPAEASTLGLHAFDSKLKDLSDEGLGDELRLHRTSLEALQKLEPSALTSEERLDVVMMSALHNFHIHVVGEEQGHLSNVEMSLHPYHMVQFQQRLCRTVEHWEALSERVGEIPRYLKQQEALLRAGVAAGTPPDIDVVSFISANQIPHVAQSFQSFSDQPARLGVSLSEPAVAAFNERCLAAATAYAEHGAFLQDVVCPASSRRILGPEEYAWRLRTTLGVRSSPDDIIARARDILAGLCQQMIALVSSINGRSVDSIQEAFAFVMEVKKTPITERDEDVIAAYREIHERTKRHMRKHKLFHFGDEVDTLAFHPPPRAFTEIGPATNIAAPLLDEEGRAFYLIQEDASLHARIQAAPGSIHEGIPGHGMQSIWWQTHRDRRPHTVRFLCVPDEIAIVRQYFGAMMNIEGWATYVEVLMGEYDFYSPEERLWETWTKMAHASRVVVDASLHTGRMTVPEGLDFLVEEAGWPRPWAEGELNRYLRVPLQASCYLLGRLEIMDLRERCRKEQGAAFSLADFHDRFFAAGPVSAGHLKVAWDTLKDVARREDH